MHPGRNVLATLLVRAVDVVFQLLLDSYDLVLGAENPAVDDGYSERFVNLMDVTVCGAVWNPDPSASLSQADQALLCGLVFFMSIS